MPSSKPLLAIYMITYNHEAYIAKAVESVMMQQTNFPYTLFLGEDCSTDKTREICQSLKQKYPDKIELRLHEKNVGVHENAAQIFKAVFSSGARYIALLEGDDYWTDPLKLQKQVDFLEQHHDYALCFHQVEIIDRQDRITHDFLTKVPPDYETLETLARLGNYIHTPSAVFRNCIVELPFEFRHCPIGDYFLYLILAQHGKLKYLEDKMAVYRYGVGIFSGKSALAMAKNNLRLFTCLLSYFDDEPIRKIFFERYLKAMRALDDCLIQEQSRNWLSDSLQYLQKNATQPGKIVRKAWSKIF